MRDALDRSSRLGRRREASFARPATARTVGAPTPGTVGAPTLADNGAAGSGAGDRRGFGPRRVGRNRWCANAWDRWCTNAWPAPAITTFPRFSHGATTARPEQSAREKVFSRPCAAPECKGPAGRLARRESAQTWPPGVTDTALRAPSQRSKT